MTAISLPDALTREHRDIDAGIEEFVEALERGTVLAEPLRTAFEALRRHIYLEEQFLFPPIRAEGLMMPILVMLREHGTLWQEMDAIGELLDERAPDDTDPDLLDRLRDHCERLLTHLDQHNSKEEPIVYPHADTALDAEGAAELEAFLRSGSMPEDWVCEGVR